MGHPSLVLSNPPHGVVDVHRAALPLGLPPAEAGLKVHHPVPEIWLVDQDRTAAEAATQELRAAGLRVTPMPADALRDSPPPAAVRSFRFEATGLTLTLDDGVVTLRSGERFTAVFCPPRQADGSEPGRSVGTPLSEALRPTGEPTLTLGFLDLYQTSEGRLRRDAVVQGVTEFSGLGASMLPSAVGNLIKFAAELEARPPHAHVDRRLSLLQARRRTTVQAMPSRAGPARQGFTYGTPALTALLASLRPELRDVSELDLSSRLVYLTSRG